MNELNLFEETHAVLDVMVALNKALREKTKEHKGFYNPKQYALELGSISFDLGRQSGKTHWIGERAIPGDLVLTINENFASHLRRTVLREGVEVFSVNSLKWKMMGKERKFLNVFVDEPSFAFRKHNIGKRDIIDILAVDYDQTFFFIGI